MRMSQPMFGAIVLAGAFAFAGCGVAPQEPDDFSDLTDAKSDAFSKKMKIVGDLDYGDSKSVKYHNPPRYAALTFTGGGGDSVSVTINSNDGYPTAWILDARFKTVAHNEGYDAMTATLASSGVFYIVLRDLSEQDATFKVKLAGQAADFYSCKTDSDCVAISQGGCCPNGWLVAVNKSDVKAYDAANVCASQPICPLYVIDDTRVAECNTGSGKCEMVQPDAVRCGGFTTNPHSCPSGYQCELTGVPDVPGTCVAK
jgi:hypothetical protein